MAFNAIYLVAGVAVLFGVASSLVALIQCHRLRKKNSGLSISPSYQITFLNIAWSIGLCVIRKVVDPESLGLLNAKQAIIMQCRPTGLNILLIAIQQIIRPTNKVLCSINSFIFQPISQSK